MNNPKKHGEQVVAFNRRVYYDYSIKQHFEAGLVLQGWEVKSLRAGRAQLSESYILLKDGAAWLVGCHISPLKTASTHIQPNPIRTRKLLLMQREFDQLLGGAQRQGYTIVACRLYWKKKFAKLAIALAKGKKEHDKRASLKERDWQRTKLQLARDRQRSL